MDFPAQIFFVVVAAAVIWALCQPRYLFIVVVKDGKVIRSKGAVPRIFLDAVDAVCRDSPSFSGTIRGVMRGKQIRLVFSRQVPQNLQQRFRNAWCLHA
jgi:hypothetical protein